MFMSELRIINNLEIIDEIDNVALKGKLKCNCGCNEFYIYHTGKQTKGILSSDIVKHKKQVIINVQCVNCNEIIKIYDSTFDGIKPIDAKQYEFKKFVLKKDIDTFKIIMMYNYYKEDNKVRKVAFNSLLGEDFDINNSSKFNRVCEDLNKLKDNLKEFSNYITFEPLFDEFKNISTNEHKAIVDAAKDVFQTSKLRTNGVIIKEITETNNNVNKHPAFVRLRTKAGCCYSLCCIGFFSGCFTFSIHLLYTFCTPFWH